MGFLTGSKPKLIGPSLQEVMGYAAPWGVTAEGIGGTTVDASGKVIGTTVDPRMSALADMFLTRMGQQTSAISGYDPAQAAKDYYAQYVEPDLLRSQEQERLALENRLLSQGMLGSTGGALRSRALGEAQQTSQRQARGEAFAQSQNLLNQMRQRELADLNAAYGIYKAPVGLMQTGIGIGSTMGQIANQYKPQYSAGSSGALGGILGAVGTAVGGPIGGMIGSTIGNAFSNNPSAGGGFNPMSLMSMAGGSGGGGFGSMFGGGGDTFQGMSGSFGTYGDSGMAWEDATYGSY